VYQAQGLRLERTSGRLTASIQGQQVTLDNRENLVGIVNHLQALLQEFELHSLYEEFSEAARLEKSIGHLATEIVKLNSGNYHSQGLSVESTGSSITIGLDQQLVFQSNQGKVQRPDDLSLLANLDVRLQGALTDLQQTIAAQLQLQQAQLEAAKLLDHRESASTSTIKPPQKGHDRGFTL
jgi:hypothetical protein